MKYNIFKLLHILGIVTWLGPSLGGYYMIIFSLLSNQREIELWLRQEYLFLVHIESAGLLLIVLSGILMVISTSWTLLKQFWLRMKILIVFLVFVPFELIQLYLYQGPLREAFSSGIGIEEAILMFDRFSVLCIVLFSLAVPAVLVLAIFKPERKNRKK
jgi:hypothetical protein